MLSNVIREEKGIILFILMFIIFACFATIRVDHIEKSNFNHDLSSKIVYNK